MKASRVYRLSTWFMAISMVANFVGVVYVLRSLRRPVAYTVNLIQPPSPPTFEPVSSVLAADSDASNVLTNQLTVSPVEFQRHVYHDRFSTFVSEGRRIAYMNGDYYYIGTRHAYGIVSDIFPERIYFVNGDYIENTKGDNNERISRAVNSLPSGN